MIKHEGTRTWVGVQRTRRVKHTIDAFSSLECIRLVVSDAQGKEHEIDVDIWFNGQLEANKRRMTPWRMCLIEWTRPTVNMNAYLHEQWWRNTVHEEVLQEWWSTAVRCGLLEDRKPKLDRDLKVSAGDLLIDRRECIECDAVFWRKVRSMRIVCGECHEEDLYQKQLTYECSRQYRRAMR